MQSKPAKGIKMKKIILCIGLLAIVLWAGGLKINDEGELVYWFEDSPDRILERASSEMCPHTLVCEFYDDANDNGELEPDECEGIKSIFSAIDDCDIYVVSFWQGQKDSDLELFLWLPNGATLHYTYEPLPRPNSYAYLNEAVLDLYGESECTDGEWKYIWILDQTYYAKGTFTINE